MKEIIGNKFREDEVNEINDADSDCTKASSENKEKVKKKLEEIDKKSSENLNKIFEVDAKIAEMTNGNTLSIINYFTFKNHNHYTSPAPQLFLFPCFSKWKWKWRLLSAGDGP